MLRFWGSIHLCTCCHSWKARRCHVPQEYMQYGIATMSTVWKIKLAQNDKQVEVSRKREFPQRSQFPGERIGNSFCQSTKTKTFSSNIYPLNLSAIQPIIQHVVCVLARHTTRRLTAGWCCIFSMLSWLVIRWRLSALLTQMLWYCQSPITPHSKTLV